MHVDLFPVHGPSRECDPICFGCYSLLTSPDDALLCAFGCGIPLCDSCNASATKEGPVEQHQAECEAFRASGSGSEKLQTQSLNTSLLHEVVLVLRYKFYPHARFNFYLAHTQLLLFPRSRCLWLRQKDTSLFSELMLFESHVAERGEDPEVEDRVSAVANVVINELRIDSVLMQGCFKDE